MVFVVIVREEGLVALHLPTGPLKPCSGLERVSRCEPPYLPVHDLLFTIIFVSFFLPFMFYFDSVLFHFFFNHSLLVLI